jgi:hypothetical protein
MTEILNSRSRPLSLKSLVLEDHSLYARHTDEPVSVSVLHRHIDTAVPHSAPQKELHLEDVDTAYKERRLKYADYVLNHLTRCEPSYYSAYQNRTTLNKLAHPVQKQLALNAYNGRPTPDLAKDIEAIYGNGAPQLEFILSELRHADRYSPGVRAEIEGGLSELTIFLLLARSLTGEDTDRYLITPSTQAQDNGPVTADGLHHGYDFIVIRTDDNARIPVQVKTGVTRTDKHYAEDILVISVAELVDGQNTSPRALAEALHSEISSTKTYNAELIETASRRLFIALDAYKAPFNNSLQ